MSLDEIEAIRLADHEGLYHEQAAALMDISRQTFGRIIQSARGKIAGAIIEGKTLRIEGGNIKMTCEPCARCDRTIAQSGCPHNKAGTQCPKEIPVGK